MDVLELATELHGHLAPGVALGVRMSEIALERLGTKRGNKRLIGVSETRRCLADALQATTGCTLGHGNAMVKDYGKLAITVGRVDSKKGVRVSLKKDAYRLSPLMREWMMRGRKLKRSEEEELAHQLSKLDEKFLKIEDVIIDLEQEFESTAIKKCDECGELVPEIFILEREGKAICKVCGGEGYYKTI
ncbi:MAG: FmdE family protein [Candidatus Hydrothermarchaeales archaeon]